MAKPESIDYSASFEPTSHSLTTESMLDRHSLILPYTRCIEKEELPEAIRPLVTSRESTSDLLRELLGKKIEVQVQSRGMKGFIYSRTTTLHADPSTALVYAIMDVDLSLLNWRARMELIDEKTPFGKILEAHKVPYRITNVAYLKNEKIFGPSGKVFYGRERRISLAIAPLGTTIARVVEFFNVNY